MLGAAATVLAAMAAHASAFETERASPFRTEICAHGAQLRAVRSGTCPPGFEPFRGAGANLFDAIWTAESMAPHVSFNDSLQSIGSYAASGLKVFRMFASLWGPYQRKCAEPLGQLEQRLMKASEFSQYDGLVCTATAKLSCVPWPQTRLPGVHAKTPQRGRAGRGARLLDSSSGRPAALAKPACLRRSTHARTRASHSACRPQ